MGDSDGEEEVAASVVGTALPFSLINSFMYSYFDMLASDLSFEYCSYYQIDIRSTSFWQRPFANAFLKLG
jgi:hypothetical protein